MENLLEVFELLAKLKSFKNASIHLNRHESTIRRQIEKLEKINKTKFFEKKYGSLNITEQGQKFLNKLQKEKKPIIAKSIKKVGIGADFLLPVLNKWLTETNYGIFHHSETDFFVNVNENDIAEYDIFLGTRSFIQSYNWHCIYQIEENISLYILEDTDNQNITLISLLMSDRIKFIHSEILPLITNYLNRHNFKNRVISNNTLLLKQFFCAHNGVLIVPNMVMQSEPQGKYKCFQLPYNFFIYLFENNTSYQ